MNAYQTRCKRAQEEMRRQGMDVLLVAPSSDLVYLTGIHTFASERLAVFVLPASGDPLMVVPELEATMSRGKATFFELRMWTDGQDPYALLLAIAPAGAPRVGVTDQMMSGHLLRVQSALANARFVLGSPVLTPLRQVKDATEIAALRRSGAATDATMADLLSRPLVGRSEKEVGREINDLLLAHGHQQAGFGIVASGPNSGDPHRMNSDRTLQKGDSLVLDFGGVYDDYFSDITRSVFVGSPPEEYRRIYEVVQQAQEAAFRAVRPGMACQEVDRAARRVIAAAGYGEYFIHRAGHGLGLDVHEEPYMVEGNAMPLEPGMVFSIEPGIYIPGRYGVRIEDIVVVTESGGERLNAAPRELRAL